LTNVYSFFLNLDQRTQTHVSKFLIKLKQPHLSTCLVVYEFAQSWEQIYPKLKDLFFIFYFLFLLFFSPLGIQQLSIALLKLVEEFRHIGWFLLPPKKKLE